MVIQGTCVSSFFSAKFPEIPLHYCLFNSVRIREGLFAFYSYPCDPPVTYFLSPFVAVLGFDFGA